MGFVASQQHKLKRQNRKNAKRQILQDLRRGFKFDNIKRKAKKCSILIFVWQKHRAHFSLGILLRSFTLHRVKYS